MYKIALSPYAKIFYNEWLLEPSSSRYNLSIDQTLYGLDPKRLKAALKKYVTEHALLNSHIHETSGQPFWVKNDEIYELEYSDITGTNTPTIAELYSYVSRGFDLHRGPLYRFKLIHTGKKAYRFIMVMHHLIMDGSASLDLGVFTAIANYYNNENYTTKYSISEQIELITNLEKKLSARLEQNHTKYQEFWHKQLSDVEGVDLTFLKLGDESAQHKNTEEISGAIGEIKFSYDGAKLKELNQVKSKYGITPYIYGLSIFASLLHRYTGQESLAVSYPISIKDGKESPDFIYGSQINTNLIPYRFDKTTTIVDLFKQGQEFFRLTTRDDAKHGYYPIIDVMQKVDNKKLLNICFAQTFFREKPLELYGITNTKVHTELRVDGVVKDIFLFEQDARSSKEQLDYRVRYDKRTINAELLNNFVVSYQKLFSEILDDLLNGSGDRSISSYNILDAKQYQKIVYEFNQTERDYPRDKTVHALLEEQALKTPNKLAVVYEDKKLTYQELNQKANQLANYLLTNYGIKPDDLVVLCLDRSEQIIIAMLGVLKAGGAYVPVDPGYPDERIGYILGDTKTKVVLANDVHRARLQKIIEQKIKNLGINVIAIDDKKIQSQLTKQENANPTITTQSFNLIYVIYTSGTTGNPKGVMIEHYSVVSYVIYLIGDSKLSDESIGSQYAGFGFDAVVIEIYPILLSGGTLHIVREEDRFDVAKLNNFFNKNRISYAFLPPKIAEIFFKLENSSLINLIVGGEKLGQFANQGYRVINAYGPTETTVQSTSFIVDKLHNNIPIGKPIDNVKCYVVDGSLNLLPAGAIGELVIGGESLARGYYHRPDLTKEKFISNPFQTQEEKVRNRNSRLYRTGDLVRWLFDGNLEYIGRNDFQVKIRGYRIELGEIENKLLSYPGIKQVAVIAREKGNNKYLVAYYTANRGLDQTKLRDYLLSFLPNYMLPNTFIYMQSFPLTENGKLDRRVLPEPELTDLSEYIAPRNELEEKICEAYTQILNLPIERIGITDDFFRIGGNSILAVGLVAKLSKIRECRNIKVVDIFKHTTVAQLSRLTELRRNDGNVSNTVVKRGELETNIAIIAISGAFSGCENADQYWELIQSGKEGIKNYSPEACRALGISEEIINDPNFVAASGHVPNIDKFDAKFWDLAPNEVKSLDPQIRKFLEHCWCALEDSGYLLAMDQMNIGVFAGGGASGYSTGNLQDNRKSPNARGLSHLGSKDILVTKISYLLGLTGMANNINTACSTSLVTVAEACTNLILGRCNMALAGGVSLLMPEEVGHIYQDGMIYSKEEHCRVFDDRSSGIIHGSGVGVVLLKRLSEAKKDHDNIIAVIKGYCINNDGNRKISYTAPSVYGQKECVINAQRMAGITSNDIDYIECHGTGTKLGDPIEVQALHEAFVANADKSKSSCKCIIGSVKANIGHSDSAAGIAGLIKICKMLEHKIIPKQINLDAINTILHLEDTNFEIATSLKKWKKAKQVPCLAGISSFGIGGTNAHIIVSEYLPDNNVVTGHAEVTELKSCQHVLPLSAKSISSFEVYKKDFIGYLASTKADIKNIAYTLQSRRLHFNFRSSVVCDSITDAINKLKTNAVINRVYNLGKQNVIFMFPGQGNQYANMSLGLYQADFDYKRTVDKCLKLVNKYTNFQFEKILFPALFNDEYKHEINQTRWAQLALFIIEYSLAKLLESINISATSYIGHSIGEYVAATLCGVFNLEDAIKLVIARGQLMQAMPLGAMLSIQEDVAKIATLVKNNHCEIAVINSSKNCVVSGTQEAIENLKSTLDKLGTPTIALQVSHAYHSSYMEEAAKKFALQFEQIKLKKPRRRFISNLTGKFITAYDAIRPQYWADHMRNTVLFSEGIKSIFHTYSDLLFIEVGVGKSSISFVKQHEMRRYNTVQLLNSKKDNSEGIKDAYCRESIINRLWLGGYCVDFDECYGDGNQREVVKLPNYHFDHATYWENQGQTVPVVQILNDAKQGLSEVTIEDIRNRVIEQNLSDKYYEVAKVFIDVLGVEKLSIHDNFFGSGGDSLMAVSVVARLQQHYKISMDDFLKLPTVAKVAENVPFVQNNLHQKLEQIKSMYLKKETCLVRDVEEIFIKQQKYLYEVEQLVVKNRKKKIRTVLLTGATGHVGCNILYQLLHETPYKIYLLIRASSIKEANEKINHRFRYYFDSDLDSYGDRVIAMASDLEKSDLGITQNEYQRLVADVDSIIHSAALVKHYGTYDTSYSANVQTTINLLELSRLTASKDFHYISTIGVLVQDGYVPNHSYYVFLEEDDAGILLGRNNSYAKTKYEGEVVVSKYRKYGVTGNIYRLGNVAMHSTNYRHQENIEDNAFFIQLKTLLKLGVIYEEILKVEVSPVDCTAMAIVKLFDQFYLSDKTYHIFNPYLCNLCQVLAGKNKLMKIGSINEFVSEIEIKLKGDSLDRKQMELFMLHQKWLGEIDVRNITRIEVLQDKTNAALAGLGFFWPRITKNMWSDILDKA